MQVTSNNDVKVYNLTASKSLPQWLEEARKTGKSLRRNNEFRRRIDLIQDFEFNIASTRVRASPDGQYIVAAGIYAPEVKIYETAELGLKCARGIDHEVIDFLFLGDDYRKLVFLRSDRMLEFHSQAGWHHKLRIPKAGRSLAFDAESCTLFVGGSSSEVVRVDLEVGTFVSPIQMRNLQEVNAVAVNPLLPLVSCAGDGGLIESFDIRAPSRVLRRLFVCESGSEAEVTCCTYSQSGMQLAAGTSEGLVRVYDIRSCRPVAERDHMNGYPICSVSFQTKGVDTKELCVGSADRRSIKIWDANTSNIVATAESNSTINQVEFYPNSGLFFVANDSPRVGIYFVPSLGLAPPWCSFLENITEELEESKEATVFEDFQFVTNDQLEQLGATQLIGTKFLQPYMHGYFMQQKLYSKLKSALDPFAYEEYRKQRIQQKLEAKRTMRTRIKTQVHVNPKLHEQLQELAEQGEPSGVSKKRKESAEKAKVLLADERFKVLFADPDFAIEEQAEGAKGTPLASILAGGRKKPKRRE